MDARGAGVAILAITCWAEMAAAAEHHVDPDGTPAGDGSSAAPWDLATALQHPPAVQPGDTLWLHGGTYLVLGGVAATLTGTAEAPIIVRQAAGERATLDTGASAQNRISIAGDHTWYWGFEVTSSALDRWDDGSGADRGHSIDVNSGEGIKLINLVVHDTQAAIGFWSAVTQGEVYGCLIYYNGYDFTDRGHGHGIYTQNIAGPKRLADNILFGAYSHGIHAYTEGGEIDDFLLEGNIGFENGVVSTISGRTRNLLIGGAPVAQDPVVRSNYTYFVPASEGTSGDLGYGSGTANAVVQDNVFVGGDTAFRLDSTNPTVDGNVFYGPLQGVDATTFPSNEYYDTTPPSGLQVFVRPNEYDPTRGHIVVYNWDALGEVAVDPSAVLAVGDLFDIRDAQSYFGTPVLSGQYDGTELPLSMTGTEVAAVIGTPATPYVHTPSTFGVFVLEKTGEGPVGTGGAGGDAAAGGASAGGSSAGGAGAALGAEPDADGGCACRTAPTPSGGAGWLSIIAALVYVARVTRRSRPAIGSATITSTATEAKSPSHPHCVSQRRSSRASASRWSMSRRRTADGGS